MSEYQPNASLRFACGSQSTISTRRPASASITARFAVEVVFVTPPLWLASTITNAPDPSLPTALRPSICTSTHLSTWPSLHTSFWTDVAPHTHASWLDGRTRAPPPGGGPPPPRPPPEGASRGSSD